MNNLDETFLYEEIMTMEVFIKAASWNFGQNSSKIL